MIKFTLNLCHSTKFHNDAVKFITNSNNIGIKNYLRLRPVTESGTSPLHESCTLHK